VCNMTQDEKLKSTKRKNESRGEGKENWFMLRSNFKRLQVDDKRAKRHVAAEKILREVNKNFIQTPTQQKLA
jgi:hypothetical protein